MSEEYSYDSISSSSNLTKPLMIITDSDSNTVKIDAMEISSANFDGGIPRSRKTITYADIKPGVYFYLNPSSTDVYMVKDVYYEEVETSPYNVTVLYIDNDEEKRVTALSNVSVEIISEDWDQKELGLNGWAITSGGNAIFTNIAARGIIEATAGKFGDWSVGDYEGYDGLNYSLNSLEAAVTPTNLYLKSNTLFGNYSWNITSVENADFYMMILRDLNKPSTPVDQQPIFYVRDTGSLYSLFGTFEESLTSYGPLTAYSDGTAPSADLYTNYTGENAIHAHQTNTGQTATVLRLDSARTTTLSSYHFIRAYSAVGTAADEEFQVLLNGVTRGDGAYSSPTADYAEFFEWEDGNPSSEDRVGYSVSLVGNKIKIAELGETPIGIISATPSVVGDSPWNRWKDKYLKDEFGRELYELCVIYQWEENKKLVNYFSDRIPEGVIVPEYKEVINSERKVLNPDFNEELEYVSRDDRPEWDTVGLLGKIRLRKGQVTAPTWIKLRDISENVEEWLVK